MTPEEFLRTVYLGDRACKSIVLDGWKSELKIQIDCISRARSTHWDYYTAEDLPDGYVVFEGVESVVFEPAGHMPNDWIELASVASINQSGLHRFVFSAGAADKLGNTVEVAITIIASAVALDDHDGVRIRE
ncbi:hypothetical protein GNX71_28545 [Variovorax sp. RKNM96]|uniref:DUF6258 family protein n=1 Tax=Variovorax sp. RKNM96 TaxID=2681552 RepID=UPI00197FA593|nr:DUF6258 family protein [Variovorax sp. RKNM96]QSI33304.1 hypothetical protein GNX71_28545 [Variovorax sp. RKNM96]